MELRISQITEDAEIQQRVEMKDYIVRDYTEAMRRGDKFPPIKAIFDGDKYWLADGFHRVAAAKKIGLETIEADVKEGGRRDALLCAIGANDEHGLRRSIEDKRRAAGVLDEAGHLLCHEGSGDYSLHSLGNGGGRATKDRCRIRPTVDGHLQVHITPQGE